MSLANAKSKLQQISATKAEFKIASDALLSHIEKFESGDMPKMEFLSKVLAVKLAHNPKIVNFKDIHNICVEISKNT